MAKSGSLWNYGSDRSGGPPAETPHFFKIIHSGVCPDKLLRIPPKFVMKYGRELSNRVFLNVPNGAIWEVELMKSREELWFSNGWEQFTDYYSIRHGHFLVFRYDKNSHFHVLIFDMSAAEIEYPSFPVQGGGQSSLNPCCLQEETDDSTEMELGSTPEIKQECDMEEYLKVPRKQQESSKHESDALRKSKDFKSKYPYCVVLMQPSHVCSTQSVTIPMWFGRKYLGKRSGEVLLKLSGSSRTWSGECYYRVVRYSLCWFSFVKDNKIKAGDVCAFELIQRSEQPVFNVTIFRASAKG